MAFGTKKEPVYRAVLYQMLVEHVTSAREGDRRGIAYQKVTKTYYNLAGRTLYPNDPELHAALAGIHDDCIKAGVPPLDVAVWTNAGKPSTGYRNLASWKDDWNAVLAQENWPPLYEE